MSRLNRRRVIVTSLALALMLGGGAYAASKQQAQAETALEQQAVAGQSTHNGGHRSKPFGKDGEGRSGPQSITEEAASILGMDNNALTAALKDKTLVEIAKEKGISEADLIAKLQAVRAKKLDDAVKAGKIKAEHADKIKANMQNHLKFMVNHKDLGHFHGGKGLGMRGGMLPSPDKLAAILNLTEDQLKTQLNEGKSLAEIAQAQGISKEQLIAKIKEEITPWIEKIVDHKRGSDASSKQGQPVK